MAAWTGNGFTADYVEPSGDAGFGAANGQGFLASTQVTVESGGGNTTGNGQVFP